MNVAVVGASPKPERYAYQAVQLLTESGHRVFPVHPRHQTVLDLPVFPNLAQIPDPVDTVTLYVGPNSSSSLTGDILASSPRRIIFNPGTENDELEKIAQGQGIRTLHACTLVLLKTGAFDTA